MWHMPAACRQGSLTSEIYVTLAEHRCRQANPKLPDDRQVVLMFTPEWAPMCGFYITVPASCVCVNVNVNGYEKPFGVCDVAGGLGPVRSVMDAGLLQRQLRAVLLVLHRHLSTRHLLLLYRAGEHCVYAMACMMSMHMMLS